MRKRRVRHGKRRNRASERTESNMFVTYLFATNMFVMLRTWETGNERFEVGGIVPQNPR
jgi:hypothetical protein